MKKVICVDAENKKRPLSIKEGCVYTVIRSDEHSFNVPAYFLAECDPLQPFSQDRFVPLSSISETEFIRNYNTEPCAG